MRLNLKHWRLVIVPALALAVVGCGGVSASRSVSPASFFIPGFMKAEPPPPPARVTVPDRPATELASS